MVGLEKGKKNVLVVEDEPLQRLGITDLLTDAGFAAIGAESAHEALELLKGSDQFSAVITDIDLPGDVNGFGIAWCAHSLGLAIIIVSGRVTPSQELLPPGSVFRAKPVDDHALLKLLRERILQQGI